MKPRRDSDPENVDLNQLARRITERTTEDKPLSKGEESKREPNGGDESGDDQPSDSN